MPSLLIFKRFASSERANEREDQGKLEGGQHEEMISPVQRVWQSMRARKPTNPRRVRKARMLVNAVASNVLQAAKRRQFRSAKHILRTVRHH